MSVEPAMGDWLYESLPELYRSRDAEQGYPLRDLLFVLGEQGDILWGESERLYDNQFLETCEPSLVPYLAALFGYRPVHDIGDVSQRALAARWIALVRSKGTAATLEEVARGASGWPAKVVEFFQLLVHAQYVNHLRPQVDGAMNMRNMMRLEDIGSAFDSASYTVDVGRISQGEGLHNIANVGLYLWRLRPGYFPRHRAFELGPRQYTCHPLGLDTQCFNFPLAEPDRKSLAKPEHLPIPMSRRRLHDDFEQYHPRAFRIWIDNLEIDSSGIHICDLSDDGGAWAHVSDNSVAFDPVLGRIATPQNDGPPDRVDVMFHDALPGDAGGSSYERAAGFAAELQPITPVTAADNLQVAIDGAISGGAIEIRDSERYDGAFSIGVNVDDRIELRAANGTRPTLELTVNMEIEGAAESEVTINGLLVAGGALIVPDNGNNELRRLTLRHVTLLPGITADPDGTPNQPGAASIIVEIPNLVLEIERSFVGAIRVHPSTVIVIRDCAVDANERHNIAIAALDNDSPAGRVTIENSTVIGKISANIFTLISNSILDASLDPAGDSWTIAIQAQDTQQGCARFSWVPSGSRIPRRYRCQPSLALGSAFREAETENPLITPAQKAVIERRIIAPLKPSYSERRCGRAAYLQLLTAIPASILTGADDESEMGVWQHIRQPQRESNLAVRQDEFLPNGLEANHVYET